MKKSQENLHSQEEEKIIIINDKTIATRVNPKKEEKSNTLDLSIVTPKLKAYVKSFTVDSKREWAPANVVRLKGGKTKYM